MEDAVALLDACTRPVVFTGAGMSAESGIATFRGSNESLWSRFRPEELATPTAFHRDPALVWGWYVYRMAQLQSVRPHDGHVALVRAERRWSGLIIVTQNVDDLHEKAGSSRVLHLHGELMKLRCSKCERPFTGFELPGIAEMDAGQRLEPPHCGHCGGPVRPGVVWFGESLPTEVWQQAHQVIAGCDLLLVVGTSGQVEPAASLVSLARAGGARVVLIDPGTTGHAALADAHLRGAAGKELPRLLAGVPADPRRYNAAPY